MLGGGRPERDLGISGSGKATVGFPTWSAYITVKVGAPAVSNQ